MLEAIEDTIKQMESYDTTTVEICSNVFTI